MTETYLIYGAVFISAFLMVEAIYQLMVRPREERKALTRRLGGERRSTVSIRKREEGLLDRVLGPLAPGGLVERLRILLIGAGLTWTPGIMLAVMLACAVWLGFFLRTMQGLPLPLSVFLGGAGGLLLPILFVRIKRARRLKRLVAQLPNALELMVRGLKAGHPVPVAMKAIADQMAEPVSVEFDTACEEMQLGLDLAEAIERLADRVPVQDVRFMAVSIAIQSKTGGNLAEVLSNLARVIRARDMMYRKARAISAEGRMSFWFCMIIPFLFGGAVNMLNPGYYGEVWGDPAMTAGLIVAACLQTVCAVWIWRLVNFRI